MWSRIVNVYFFTLGHSLHYDDGAVVCIFFFIFLLLLKSLCYNYGHGAAGLSYECSHACAYHSRFYILFISQFVWTEFAFYAIRQ